MTEIIYEKQGEENIINACVWLDVELRHIYNMKLYGYPLEVPHIVNYCGPKSNST